MKKVIALIACSVFLIQGCNTPPDIVPTTSAISVYPNPAQDVAYIMLDNTTNEAAELNVFDPKGNLILQQDILSETYKTMLRLQQTPKGTYHIVFKRSGSTVTKRFVKL
jgi:PBP1b-binding outer membrane lipoprotein LpoB